MHADPIDPRDVSWEANAPAYRVYFFTDHGASDEWRLVGARDVHQVIAWADTNAAGRPFVLYAEIDTESGPGRSRGLVRLAGTSP